MKNNILAISLVVGAQPVDTSPKQVTRHTHTGNIGRSSTFGLVHLCLDLCLDLFLSLSKEENFEAVELLGIVLPQSSDLPFPVFHNSLPLEWSLHKVSYFCEA